MTRTDHPGRLARLAVAGLSGGVLVMIWSAVWYAALRAGRSEYADWKLTACGIAFGCGLLAAAGGLFYLRSRKLSLTEGSTLIPALPPETPLPPAADTASHRSLPSR